MKLFRSADSISLAYSDVTQAKKWWTNAFDCQEVKVPDDWDNTQPSDVALKFRGEDDPTILLSDKAEEDKAQSTVPVIFSDKLKKSHEHLVSRGLSPSPILDRSGHFFEVRDLEGNVIEICEEP